MYSQAYVSAGVLRLPGATVAVRDRGHWTGVCGKRMGPWRAETWVKMPNGWKSGRSLENRACVPARSPKITSGLDNGRSQSPQWGMWIQRQSPVRCRGTRSCHSMDSILSVLNQNFSGNRKELTRVLWSRRRNSKSFTLTIPSNAPLLLKRWDGSMYSQADVRAGKCCCRIARLPGASVAVRHRECWKGTCLPAVLRWRKAGGPSGRDEAALAVARALVPKCTRLDGKVVTPGAPRTDGWAGEDLKITSAGSKTQNNLVWRIGNEEEALPRNSSKRLPRNWRIEKNLSRKNEKSSCEHGPPTLVQFVLQELDLSLEFGRDGVHDSLGNLRIKSLELHTVLVINGSWMIHIVHTSDEIDFR